MATAIPMTQLDAVNICLSSIGEPSINALDGAGIDAAMANDLLNEASRSLQLKGWHWNRETMQVSPDVNGFFTLPNNCLKVDSTSYDKDLDVVQRGKRLYNRTDNTYVFTLPIYIDIVVGLDFEELPQAARDYVTAEAAYTLQQRILGAPDLNSYLKPKRDAAWMELIREEVQVADPNILKDNWSTMGIVQRGWFRRGAYL